MESMDNKNPVERRRNNLQTKLAKTDNTTSFQIDTIDVYNLPFHNFSDQGEQKKYILLI